MQMIPKYFDYALNSNNVKVLKKTRYNRIFSAFWCRLSESNQQPIDYKSIALPIELRRHLVDTVGIEPTTSSV